MLSMAEPIQRGDVKMEGGGIQALHWEHLVQHAPACTSIYTCNLRTSSEQHARMPLNTAQASPAVWKVHSIGSAYPASLYMPVCGYAV